MQLFHIHYIYSYRLENKVTAKQGLEMFRIHCQKYAIKMTNGMRKVRKGVVIFVKPSLDSYKIHLGHLLLHGTDLMLTLFK